MGEFYETNKMPLILKKSKAKLLLKGKFPANAFDDGTMKFKSRKTKIDGEYFPSGLEAAVFSTLKLLQKSGEITDIQRQPRVPLVSGIRWFVDYKCTKADGSIYYVEAKGLETEAYKLKRKLWFDFGPAPLEIWKGNWKKPFLAETVIPNK